MAKHVETQIEQRNRLADMHRRDQNPVMRAVSGTGLAVANTWDRITQPFRSDRAVFAGATAFGVARGAVLGAVAGVIAFAVFPATFGVGAILAATAVGATAAGVYDGQSELEKHWGTPKDNISDKIAEKTGAVPTPGKSLEPLSKDAAWDLKHMDKPSRVIANADKLIAQTDNTLARAGWADRVDAQRGGRGGPNFNGL